VITIAVTERPHSAISPSSFDRIAACTKSYWHAQRGCNRVAGDAAIVGTAAHAVLEAVLRGQAALEEIGAVKVDGIEVPVDDEMRTAVRFALNWINQHRTGRELLVEHQIRLPWGQIRGYIDLATADAPYTVVDYKHGFNEVPANSAQLGLYALALVLERERSVEGEGTVTTVVIQPRAKAAPARTHDWSYADLRALRDRLFATLDRIRREDFTYADGPHCRWCPAAAVCPHLAAVARDAVATQFAVPELVAGGEFGARQLNDALKMTAALEHWARSSHALAREYLMQGGKLPDFKLVKKRSGNLTVVSRDDPRSEIDVPQTLKAALRSSVASGDLAVAMKSVLTS
jgi:Protein of unknown function (DUF2800)